MKSQSNLVGDLPFSIAEDEIKKNLSGALVLKLVHLFNGNIIERRKTQKILIKYKD